MAKYGILPVLTPFSILHEVWISLLLLIITFYGLIHYVSLSYIINVYSYNGS